MAVRPQICRRRTAEFDQAGEALVSGIESLDNRRNELLIVFSWDRIPAFERHGFTIRENTGNAGVIVLDLTLGPEAIFRQFSETRRNKIRRAMRAEVSVTEMSYRRGFRRVLCDLQGLVRVQGYSSAAIRDTTIRARHEESGRARCED